MCSSARRPGSGMACLVLERYSPMTCKCHVRNVTGYLQQFSSLGPKPRLFYEVLDFLTIRNIVFYILFRPKGPRGLVWGDIAGSQVAAFFLTPVHLLHLKLSASSLSTSRSSPWCLTSERAQPAVEQVCMASESWALCQPQSPITIRV